jgi:hypothetical protein
MEYMIASWSKKGPIKDYRWFPGLEKGSSLTWTELIYIGGKNPVFKYFWSQVDKPPAWKSSSPLKYAQVIKSSEIEHSHHLDVVDKSSMAKIMHPNLRKASMKLAYW